MRLSIRVGDSITDLAQYNRVSVEPLGSRLFLVGVLNSGRVRALYALAHGARVDEVLDGLHSALGTGKKVCVLNRDLVPIELDPEALRAISEHNRELDEREAVGTPNTLASAGHERR